MLALRPGSPRHSLAPAAPQLHPLPHPHRRRHRRQTGMALPLVSHSTPRPPGARSLDPNTHGDMDVHQRAGRPGQRGHNAQTQDLTDGEISLLRFLLSPLGSERWETHCVHFPFLSIEYTESLTIGELLLNVVYTHCILENPGVGIFQQLTGWAMGTNPAPTWST